MLNAMAEDILCPACNKTNHFSMEKWKDLLEDPLKEVHEFKIGEGQPSTIMSGEYNYSMMFGRQDPRCSKCKEGIDLSKIEEYSNQKHIKCSKCSNTIFIRKSTDAITAVLPRIKYLAGEDEDLISVNNSPQGERLGLPADPPVPQAGASAQAGGEGTKPVLFTCPSCAGNLEIDGSDRMVTCKFCNSQIYLPDDLWFRLHPSDSVIRWYILYDSESVTDKLPGWYNLSDIAIDKEGNLYAASSENSDKDFIVWSIGPDLKTRWIKDGLKFNNDSTGITVASDGNLYLWDRRKHSLLKLSSKNGDVLEKTEGKPATSENPYPFNLKGCSSLVSCADGSILALVNNTIARFSQDSKRIDLWSGLKFGFFPSGLGKKIPDDDSEYAPNVYQIHSYPKRIDSDYTRLNIGWDGFLYMIDRSSSDGKVAKFDPSGLKLKSYYIPLQHKECKACADKDGNIFIIGTTDESMTRLIKILPDGEVKTLLTDIIEGGVLNQEYQLAIAPDGTIYIMKYNNRIKVFNSDLKMIYISEQCKEDDEEKLNEKKESIEKDEEFS